MKEIRIHGRGGQGSLVLAQFMAIAALQDDTFGLAFPYLGGGGERRGKPVMAFCRLDSEAIRLRSNVREPDFLIVQDATIFQEEDVLYGLKPGSVMLVNTDKGVDELGLPGIESRVLTFSGGEVARRILGRPIMNTALLGAFAALTGELSLEACCEAVRSKFPGELGTKNVQVVEASFQQMRDQL